jgi:hypothetical protein
MTKLRGWMVLSVACACLGASPARAQDGEGGGDDGGDALAPPSDYGGGVYTQEAYPQAAPLRPIAFGAPAAGTIRIMPRWDNYVFTEHAPVGALGTFDVNIWTTTFGVDIDIGDAVFRATVPLGYERVSTSGGTGTGGGSDQAELGNVLLEGLANIDLGSREQRLLIGGGVAVPTATDQACASGTGCSGRGNGVRQIAWAVSFRNAPAWTEQALTIWPSIEYRLGVPWFLFAANGTIPVFFPINSQLGGPLLRGNVELMLALDVSGAVRIVNVVDVGVSFLAWALPSGAGYTRGTVSPDLGQTALSFFVRTDPELDVPVFGGAEFILNLDNSWGPTGDTGKLWGLRLFIGGRFDV